MVRGRGLWSSLGGGCCVWAELRLPGPPEPIEWRACWSVDWGQVTGKNRRTDFNRGRDRDVVEPQGQLRRDVFLRADVSVQLVPRPWRHLRLLSRDAGVRHRRG